MIKAVSHLILATNDVNKMTEFFELAFEVEACYKNDEFSEFILENGFRVAFFKPLEVNRKYFDSDSQKASVSIGITVADVDAFYANLESKGLKVETKPKDHPWGFRSFLLRDPDSNRWEITQSPTNSGMLKEVELAKMKLLD